MRRLWIRTEASAEIGMGHFMRCFALAEAARLRGHEVTFLLNAVTPAIQARLEAIGAGARIMNGALAQDGNLLAGLEAGDWLLLDSYQVDEAYLMAQTGGAKLAVVDDLGALSGYDCDLIINPASSAQARDYAPKTKASLALGTEYALIRREFTRPYDVDTRAPFVTLTFGGSDPAGLSAPCAQSLHEALPDMLIRLISGPVHVHLEALLALEQKLDRLKIIVSPSGLAQVLAGSALVVTAAGGSVAEIAAVGLPALVLVVYDNQAAILDACPYPVIDVRTGLPDDLGARVTGMLADKRGLVDMAARAHASYDGRGTARILDIMDKK